MGSFAEDEVKPRPLPDFSPSAYAQLQPHQLLSQPPSKHLQPQFVIQQQQPQPQPQQSRPALQAQSHPQLASIPPSVALQPSPEPHAMPLGPVTSTLPLQCPTANLYKPGSTQHCHPPTPDAGPHNGYPEGLSHTPQRRFQHASAVILQLQPASPVVSKTIPGSGNKWGHSSGNPTAPIGACFYRGEVLWIFQERSLSLMWGWLNRNGLVFYPSSTEAGKCPECKGSS